MTTPRSELRDLKAFIARTQKKFIDPYLQAASLKPPTRDEILDAGAFAVLAHGALENFIEGLGLWVAETIEHKWIYKKKVSRSMAALMLHTKVPTYEDQGQKSCYDILRAAAGVAKSAISDEIYNNNGIATKHLYSIFRPLGIDVPNDAQLIGSLEALVTIRHKWAHQYRYEGGASAPKGAGDLKKIVDDCLQLAEQLVSEVAAAKV